MDRYERYLDDLESPATRAYAVTPDDDEDLPDIPRALYIGTGGDLTVILLRDDTPVTFVNVRDGDIIPMRPRRVMESSTVSDLVAFV